MAEIKSESHSSSGRLLSVRLRHFGGGLCGILWVVLCQEHRSEAEDVVAKIEVPKCGPKEKDSKVVRAGKRRSCWVAESENIYDRSRLKPKLAVCGAVARTTGLYQPVPGPC